MNRRLPTEPAALLALAQENDRVALARLVSMVERGGGPGLEVARLAYRGDVPYTVGLTGAPGAGKSTLTDRLITLVRSGWPAPSPEAIDQVGVLAIDPTSPFSGGAILGDRVRMQTARPRSDRLHPLHGHAGAPRWPGPGRPRCRARPRCGRRPLRHRRDGGRGSDGGRGGIGRRHHHGRGHARLGRLHAGEQGRSAGDRRPVRDQQGRSAGSAGGAARSRTDARPLVARRVAAADHRHGRLDR